MSSERRAKSEMEKSRRKLELGDDEPDMVEIGKEILDSEDTDPEDDVPLASLQPVLVGQKTLIFISKTNFKKCFKNIFEKYFRKIILNFY